MTAQAYAAKFAGLVVNRRADRARPHKICMLLAVLDLARAGRLIDNMVLYGPELLERYSTYFEAVRAPGEALHAYYPFFHLKGRLADGSPSFWHLVPQPGRADALRAMESPRRLSDLTENVAYATLDPELHQLLQSEASIDFLSVALSQHWFHRGLQDLAAVVERSSRVSHYERTLRGVASIALAGEPLPPAYVRNPAFRRVVTQAYDYRCAASGVRILLPNGEAMVEAAHIHPFSEAGDDDPCNGLALSPDMHWAMDHNLIAPGPDFRWYVSRLLDPRVPDYRSLRDLDERELLLPMESRMYPKREALAWRLERLRDSEWTPLGSTTQ